MFFYASVFDLIVVTLFKEPTPTIRNARTHRVVGKVVLAQSATFILGSASRFCSRTRQQLLEAAWESLLLFRRSSRFRCCLVGKNKSARQRGRKKK